MKGTFSLRSVWSQIALLGLGVLLLLGGCNQAPTPIDLIPEDTPPGIAVIAPGDTRLLLRSGDAATVTLKLVDNEELSLLRVVQRVFDRSDVLVGESLPQDFTVEGNSVDFPYAFTAPALDPFFKIQYVCYAIDVAGGSAETFFWVSILPGVGDEPPYETLTYEADTLYNSLTGANYAFNFASRMAMPMMGQSPDPLRPQFDIAENSGTGQGAWQPSFISPNNAIQGNDSSVFVITDETRFNYELANYNTIFEAFFSDAAPSATAPPTNHPIEEKNKDGLEVGDIVIVRLITTPQPQFAVMRITEVFDDGAGINIDDYIVFDYKLTSP